MPKTKRFRLHLSSKPKLQVHSLLLPGCYLLKTSSFAVDRDQFNINGQVECPTPTPTPTPTPKGILVESPKYTDTPKNLKGTHRFFVRTGESNSLAEEKLLTGSGTNPVDSSKTLAANEAMRSAWNFEELGMKVVRPRTVRLPRESIALTAYSMEPYKEFRQSMMEMVASRMEQNRTVDWDYLEELVICYLELNEKCCYEHILSAFAGVIEELYHIIGQIPY